MDKKGFTLVELLVVMGLMGVFLLIVSPSLLTSIKSYIYIENEDTITKRLGNAANLIKDEVRKAENIFINDVGTSVEIHRIDGDIVVLEFEKIEEDEKYIYGSLRIENHQLIREGFIIPVDSSEKIFSLYTNGNNYLLVAYLKVLDEECIYDMISLATMR